MCVIQAYMLYILKQKKKQMKSDSLGAACSALFISRCHILVMRRIFVKSLLRPKWGGVSACRRTDSDSKNIILIPKSCTTTSTRYHRKTGSLSACSRTCCRLIVTLSRHIGSWFTNHERQGGSWKHGEQRGQTWYWNSVCGWKTSATTSKQNRGKKGR